VTSTTDVEVLELDRADLLKLVTKAPPVMRKLLESLARRLRDADLVPTAH
jgi:CRP-like cAMP-binding protein